MTTTDILREVAEERERQKVLWSEKHDGARTLPEWMALLACLATACLPGTSKDYWGHDKLRGFVSDLTSIYGRCIKPEGEDAVYAHEQRLKEYSSQVAQKVREAIPWEVIQRHLMPFPYGEKKVAE